jgi:hypothetical protein
MAVTAPRFYHATAGTVDLARGIVYPYNKDGVRSPIQKIGVAVGGAVKVMDLGNVEYTWKIGIKGENETNRDALLTFLSHASINYAENTFTFYPEGIAGSSYTVRLWDITGIDFPRTKANLYDIEITLRKEIT